MQKIVLISLLLILSVNSFELFLSNPEQNFYLGSVQATSMEIVADESMVVVGFQSGLIETYNMQGRFLKNVTGHNNPIIAIESVNNGFLSLDNSGFLIASFSNGTQATNYTFQPTGNTLIGMTLTVSTQKNLIYLSIIYSTNILQYSYDPTKDSISLSQTYSVNNVVTATYSSPNQYSQLIVGTSQSQVIFFSCTTGNQVGTLTAPANVYPVAFIPYGNNFLMFDSGSIFTELFLDQKLGQSYQSSKPASVATVCPSNLQVVEGYSSQAVLVTFQYGQTEGQQLSYMKNNAKVLACSSNYLVSLDKSNYLAFNSYDLVDSKILGWVIAVIVISIVLFIALIVTIIYCVCKKRKQSLLNNSDYGKELNSSRR